MWYSLVLVVPVRTGSKSQYSDPRRMLLTGKRARACQFVLWFSIKKKKFVLWFRRSYRCTVGMVNPGELSSIHQNGETAFLGAGAQPGLGGRHDDPDGFVLSARGLPGQAGSSRGPHHITTTRHRTGLPLLSPRIRGLAATGAIPTGAWRHRLSLFFPSSFSKAKLDFA